MNKQDRLLALQYMLYEKIRSRIYGITGPDSEALLEYEFSFLRALPKTFAPCDTEILRDALKNSRIVLCGDFHSLASNQEAFIEVLTHVAGNDNQPPIIALECFNPEDQNAVNDYLDGKSSECELLESTRFFDAWGFPWRPIKRILDFAKKSKCPVRGINSVQGRSPAIPLFQRDQMFATQLVKDVTEENERKIIALIGEHHLSRNHLPSELIRLSPQLLSQDQITCLFFNTDKYYFKSLEAFSHLPRALLDLGEKNFCFLDTPPWGKWLSFLLWQEHLMGHPHCSHLIDWGDPHFDETCVYDTEEYFNDCFDGFLKFFGKKHLYPPLCNMYSALLSVDEEFLIAKGQQRTWSYQKFLRYDSVLDRSSKMIYSKPLCWRGLIHAVAQCLSLCIPDRPEDFQRISEPFFDNLKVSILCHSFEAIFNPVGYLDSRSIFDQQVDSDRLVLLENDHLSTGEEDSSFSEIDFQRSFELGKMIALFLSVQSAGEVRHFDYLHHLMLKNEIGGSALINNIMVQLNHFVPEF